MGFFDFIKEIVIEDEDLKKDSVMQKHLDAVENIDGTMVSLSTQGALLLACIFIMKAGSNESSRKREIHRVYSVDRKNGLSLDLKEAMAITRINFKSIDDAYEYWINVISQTLTTERERLALLANMIDIAMVDGKIDDEELMRIRLFAEVLDVDDDSLEQISTVLAIKNAQLSAKQG